MTQHAKEPRETDHWMYAQTLEAEDEVVKRVAQAIWQALESDTHDGSEDIDSIGMKLSSPDTRNRIYRMAQAAIAAIPPQWQPIETAPKDGTEVLGCDDEGILQPIRWMKHNHVPIYGWCRQVELYGEEVDGFDALWWMPLPAAPQAPALPETRVE